VLRATRSADLPSEVRQQRLLLEARALSDTGRHDLALEVISNLQGREATRLRADLHWAARRWADAAEQIELLYGDRWRDPQALTDLERADVLRAAIGYSLGEDMMGLGRFREKFGAHMTGAPDQRAFEVLSSPFATGTAEFREIAKSIAAYDTLAGFLRDMRVRYPDSIGPAAGGSAPDAPAAAPSRAGTAAART
jgi:hypothetical protein